MSAASSEATSAQIPLSVETSVRPASNSVAAVTTALKDMLGERCSTSCLLPR